MNGFGSQLGFWVATEASVAGVETRTRDRPAARTTTRSARAIGRSARALCTRPICCSALFGSLFGTLFMETVHSKKKKRTLGIWGVTIFHINDALYLVRSRINLLSFKDIHRNGYHIETRYDNNKEYLCITRIVSSQKLVVEKFPAFSSGLYYTTRTTIELNIVMSQKLSHPNIFMLWHDRLGRPGSTMMRQIIENSHGHPLKNQKILLSSDYLCTACSRGKLIVRPSHTKVLVESPTFLERL